MENNKIDIFLSYRRSEGWELTRLIYESLIENEFNVFLDTEKLFKGKFDDDLRDKLAASQIFIPILTRNSLNRCVKNKKDFVRKEIEYAIKNRKIIIPIVDDTFTMPKDIEQHFKDLINNSIYSVVNISKAKYNESIKKLYKIIFKYLQDTTNNRQSYVRKNITNFKNDDKATLLNDDVLQQILKYLHNKQNNRFVNILHIDKGEWCLGNCLFKNQNINSYYLIDINKKSSKKYDCLNLISKKIIKINWNKISKRKNFIDIILLNKILCYYKNPQEIILMLSKLLKKDGKLIIIEEERNFETVYPDIDSAFKKYIELKSESLKDCNLFTNQLIFDSLKKSNLIETYLWTNIQSKNKFTNYFDRKKAFDNDYAKIIEYFEQKSKQAMGKEQSAAKLMWLKKNYDKLLNIWCANKTLRISCEIIWIATKKDVSKQNTPTKRRSLGLQCAEFMIHSKQKQQ